MESTEERRSESRLKTNREPFSTTGPRVAVLLRTAHSGIRQTIRGVLRYARENGRPGAEWRVEFGVNGVNELRLSDLERFQIDGAIGQFLDVESEKTVLESKIPFVFIDPPDKYDDPESPFFSYSSIRIDSADAARRAAKYLLELGLEKFAFVGATEFCGWSIVRERVFCEEIAKRGFDCAVFPAPPKKRPREIEARETARWLQSLPTPIGIFAANDERGVQIVELCRSVGLRVPEDAAILGVDSDALLCESIRPSLSSVAFDSERYGFETARLLNAQMNGGGREKEILTIPASGIDVRDSTRRDGGPSAKVAEALDFIRINAGRNVGVGDVARRVRLSRQWIERLFRAERGRTIYEEIQQIRLETAAKSLVETDLTIREIGALCGFVDGNHLGKLFRKRFGVSPSEYRNNHRESRQTTVGD